MFRPELTVQYPQNLCLDARYAPSAPNSEARSYIPHIRPRGEECKEIEGNPALDSIEISSFSLIYG